MEFGGGDAQVGAGAADNDDAVGGVFMLLLSMRIILDRVVVL